MIRNKTEERKRRLSTKTLDQAFRKEVEEGLNCSPIESKALLDIVKEIYMPYLHDNETIHPGQMVVMGIDSDEPPGKPLEKCKFKPVVITKYSGESDDNIRLENSYRGVTALRRLQLKRIAEEAKDQGVLLTAEDFAYKVFNCGYRTICRDLKHFRSKRITIPVRSQQKDIGRALTHRVRAVELYIKRKLLTQIAQEMRHSLNSIQNYINKFARVASLTKKGHSISEIAFVVQISPNLVKKYQGLYQRFNTPEYSERIEEIIAQFKPKKRGQENKRVKP
ncbi:hypothetical protein ES702_03590 [subsurface metagenome]